MLNFWIIPLSIVILAAIVVIAILIARLGKSSKRARQAVSELYRFKTNYSFRNKYFELNKSIFGFRHGRQRKSQILIMSEGFKANFHLGKFVIYCSQRNMMQPLMGLGYKLRSIKPIKIDYFEKLIPGEGGNARSSLKSHVFNTEQVKQIASAGNLESGNNRLFGYCHKAGNSLTIFIGEDTKGELARYCSIDEFNRAIWPLFNSMCQNNSRVMKHQDRAKSLQNELKNAQSELSGLSRKLKYKSIDLHAFYTISNKLFSNYDEPHLLNSVVRSIDDVLKPSNIAILTQDPDNSDVFRIASIKGKLNSDKKKLKFPVDSHIRKLLNTRKQAILLPILSSGLPDDNPFVEMSLAHGYLVMERLESSAEVKGLVLIGEKTDGKDYDDSELEIFSTLANMASLAMNNLHQYHVIEKMSYTDFLTEVYNYRYFYKRLREEIFRAKRFDRMLALVIFDIDNFKSFNDTYGHQAGDEVLKNLALLVTGSVRAIDIVSRYGGEEFCIIMPDTGFANCLILVERLRKMIEAYKFRSDLVDEGYSITVSIGGAIYPVDAQTPDRFIYCADMALLKAKHDGRNRSMMFNSTMLEDDDLIKSSQQQLTDMGIYEDL